MAESSRRQYIQNASLRQEINQMPFIFSRSECDEMLSILSRYTSDWGHHRHTSFPTCDIPCRSIPELFPTLLTSLKTRVVPLISKWSGIHASHLYFVDLFFVKYKAPTSPLHQNVTTAKTTIDLSGTKNVDELPLHSDGSLISFNLQINDTEMFEGGGTYFEKANRVVRLEQGSCVFHDSKLMHAGARVMRGERVILVGFMDTVRPKIRVCGGGTMQDLMQKPNVEAETIELKH